MFSMPRRISPTVTTLARVIGAAQICSVRQWLFQQFLFYGFEFLATFDTLNGVRYPAAATPSDLECQRGIASTSRAQGRNECKELLSGRFYSV
jgi:hypothetical protein